MCKRQQLDKVPHHLRQGVHRKESTAEEGHWQQHIGIDLSHFLIGADGHGGKKADIRKNDAVYNQHQLKQRCQVQLRPEKHCQHQNKR